MGSYPSSSSTDCSMYPSYYNLSTFPTPTCGSQWTAFSASIWYRERSWTVLESNGEEYLLRYTIVRSTYYFCLISIPIPTFSLSSRHPPQTGSAASPIPARPLPRPHGGVGCSSGTYKNGYPVAMVVVVVSVVIVVVPVPKVDIDRCLREAEG